MGCYVPSVGGGSGSAVDEGWTLIKTNGSQTQENYYGNYFSTCKQYAINALDTFFGDYSEWFMVYSNNYSQATWATTVGFRAFHFTKFEFGLAKESFLNQNPGNDGSTQGLQFNFSLSDQYNVYGGPVGIFQCNMQWAPSAGNPNFVYILNILSTVNNYSSFLRLYAR
jgi:hypothetical protein